MSPCSPVDACIRWTTTVSVSLLAMVSAVVSYRHVYEPALRQGESELGAALAPLAVDGMIVWSPEVSRVSGQRRRRAHRSGPELRIKRGLMVPATTKPLPVRSPRYEGSLVPFLGYAEADLLVLPGGGPATSVCVRCRPRR